MKCAVSILAALALASPASAHRLDEYLQAARLDIASSRVDLELDLTPGVDVAPSLCRLFDADDDGRISASEAQSYAHRAIGDLTLEIDGVRCELLSLEITVPSCEAMKDGVGLLRLRASTTFAPLAAGRHELHFRNDHRPVASVYLVNALLPVDSAICIDRQDRDERQIESRVSFDVSVGAETRPTRLPWILSIVVLVLIGLVGRRSMS